MHRFFKWFLMLNKRLYKKVSFVIILALIPMLILTFNYISQQDSGFLNIVVAQVDKDDAVSTKIINQLQNEKSIIHFVVADSPQDAFDMVKSGQVDEAWIFNEDLQKNIDRFISEKRDANSAVTVVCKENSTLLQIANEKLSGTLYEHYAQSYYINFVRENLSQLDTLSNEELMTYFDNVSITEDLFVFASPADTNKTIDEPDTNYLFSPIRGLLAILTVLCGMAAAMYFMQDEKSGTFSWVKEQNRLYIGFFCILIAVLNMAFFVFISLFLSQQTGVIFKEVLSILLYSLCVSSFCLLLKQILGNIRLYASFIVLMIVIMIAVCPVFFDFRSILWIQLLFPPTYYVNVLYDNIYLLYMAIYAIVLFAISFSINKLKSKSFR